MADLVLLATAWGPKHGGINAFNMDFAKALGRLFGRGKIVCMVLEASASDKNDAAKHEVTLLAVGKSNKHSYFEDNRADDVVRELAQTGFTPGPATWWIGHDAITGELANRLATIIPASKSAVMHHMSYVDYQAFMHGDAAMAQRKSDKQAEIFSAADRAFAVGPLLLESLRRLVEPVGKADGIAMIIPGLAEIEPCRVPLEPFTGITFGRLGRENDRIKQVRLAIAAFADACNQKVHPLLPLSLQNHPQFHIYGVDRGQQQELSLYAKNHAGKVITLLPLPYEDREVIFKKLRHMELAMMLSWHEGFGLVGWEAISAEVPLIVTKNSGLYQLLESSSYEGFVSAVDIDAQEDPTGEQNFSDDDLAKVRTAIWSIANDRARAKKKAQTLLELLRGKNYTWDNAARQFAENLGIALPQTSKAIAKLEPEWDIAKQGPPFPGLLAFNPEQAAIFCGREKETEELLKRCRQPGTQFLAVVGASGSGKSSLVSAGLLSRLVMAQNPPESAGWRVIDFKPGDEDDPVESLATAWFNALPKPKAMSAISLHKRLMEGPQAVLSLLDLLPQQRLLFYIDQFEEVFDPKIEPQQRKRFIELIKALRESGRVLVVATLRDDFLSHCLTSEHDPTLVAWLREQGGFFPLAPPDSDAMGLMIEQPAAKSGLAFENNPERGSLALRIRQETAAEPGRLALMAYLLGELFKKCHERGGRMLTWQDYDGLGGVAHVVGLRADEEFKRLQPRFAELHVEGEAVLAQVFRKLVRVDGQTGSVTRQRAERGAVCADRDDAHSLAVAALLDRFTDAQVRLLVSSEDKDSHKRMVEVVHEALFRSWGQLTGWIEQNKDDLRLRSQLERASLDWQEQRKYAHRWSDERAVEVAGMLQRLGETLTGAQREFLGPVTREELKAASKTWQPSHQERASIGIRLALLGDDRPGVGVKTIAVSSIVPSPTGGNTVEIRNPLPLGEGRVRVTTPTNTTILPELTGLTLTPSPLPQAGEGLNTVILPDIVWCEVPPGRVELEDNAGSFDVAAFKIAQYPVTQAQYKLFVQAEDGYHNEAWWEGLQGPYADPGRQIPAYDNHPAVNVNWYEAVAYCRWLSQQLGHEVRLPTEWEWQQAACNGCADNKYPWGKEWDGRRCNSDESDLNRAIAVGLYAQDWPEDRPLDMAGNVWEWCFNIYAINEPYNDDEARRVIRGGSWYSVPDRLRSANRFGDSADDRDSNLGFRLAQDL